MPDQAAIQSIQDLITQRWPGCMVATQPGSTDPACIIGRKAQAFITRGPFTEMGAPTGEPDSFYVHADASTELAALLLVFARAVEASAQ